MDIKEYAIEHEEQIIEDFIQNYSTEFEEYFKGETHDERSLYEEQEWAKNHSEYWRFVELHYADYQSGGQ